jgi:hypothetical protein
LKSRGGGIVSAAPFNPVRSPGFSPPGVAAGLKPELQNKIENSHLTGVSKLITVSDFIYQK